MTWTWWLGMVPTDKYYAMSLKVDVRVGSILRRCHGMLQRRRDPRLPDGCDTRDILVSSRGVEANMCLGVEG